MRTVLISVLGLALALSGGSLFAADEGKAINTICPSSGDKIDPDLKPLSVTTKDGKTSLIGVCCKDCFNDIKKDPEKYAAAARADKKAGK